MNTASLEWMPTGHSVSLLPAGKWWDAIKVPRAIALETLDRLRDESGAVMEDPWSDTLYWLVPTGRATAWEMPESSHVTVLGDTAHLVVPGPQCTVGPHWRVPPGLSNFLTDPEKLHDALARAAAIVTKQSSAEAYEALVGHYEACSGCAHGTESCLLGRQLRQAWVGVRWS
ncbi:hypothetical protein ACQEWB_18815 [Streptomyces sp. CA-249302]|uniref:hypothetical protein n=1 Tax=Streptomyces sp. CA-249302 TaxID=3240058 RepID=UPI003D918A69